MIILIVLVYATHQTLIYQFYANSGDVDGWEDLNSNSLLQSCGEIQYFGSLNNFFFISRLFIDLEPHSHIMIEAEFLRIDNYDPIYYAINFQQTNYELVKTTQNNLCGGDQSEEIHTISIILFHNRRTVWTDFKYYYGGLISFKLSIIKCYYGSDECIENYDTNYLQWKLHQYSFNQKFITNSDGWTIPQNRITNQYCGNCDFLSFYQIQYSTQLPPHQNVLVRFFKGDEITIIVDYLYGKQVLSSYYQIEILIKNHEDPILQLNIQTTQNINYCTIRDFEVFYTQPEIYQNLKEGCLEQVDDKCLICNEGWIQDELRENCYPICGNGIIQGQEECDDANLISNQFCQLCKYSCIEFCRVCQFGICLECIDGFEFTLNRERCMPVCNDGITQKFETCDDQNNIQFDGCYKCQSNCDLRCQFCIGQKCQLCEIGWELRENKCYFFCGDGVIALHSTEQCDDGNYVQNDGCFNCQIECIPNCLQCFNNEVCFICQDHYHLEGQQCLPICGDGIIITGFEDCDDGNIEPNDGCYQCQYESSLGCLDCEKEQICNKCDSQYILNNQTAKCQEIKQLEHGNDNIDETENPLNIVCDKYFILKDNHCVNQCGNGLLQEQEECDDGNYQAADGCNGCLVEQSWKCITITSDSPSECTFIKAPKLAINYLNMNQNKQYIHIWFDQQVKIYTDQPLSETINFKLQNVDKKKWNSSLNIRQDVGSYMSFGEYIVQIEVPVLKILVNQTVANIDDAALEIYAKSITLLYPRYLNKKQKDISQTLLRFNKYIIYILYGISGLSLLLRSGDLFVEILAILQFQQYLRYINLQFPENLEIYFSINDMITVQPLLDFIHFPQLLQFIDFQSNQEYSDGKFAVYKQHPSLIINLSCQIFQCLIFLFLILLFQWIKKVLYKWIFCPKYFSYMQSLSLYVNPKILLKFSQSFYNICLDLLKLEKFMSFQGLKKALLLNGWDMIFKTLLYTRNIQTKTHLDILQLIIVSIILILYFTILLDFFKGQSNLSIMNSYEGFEILSFGRQFFFLLFLIYYQHSQVLQLELLLLTSIIQIRFIFNYRQVFNQKNYIVQIVVEISVLTFMLSSFLYIQEFNEYFNEEKKIILGWIQVIILSKGIIIELILIFKELLLKFRQKAEASNKQ